MVKPYRDKEIWGRIFIRLIYKAHEVLTWLATCEAKALCFLWRVKLDKGCIFHGRISLWRAPDSTIEIGQKCRFRSGKWSNRIGLNRPCMVSTLRHKAHILIGENCGFSGTVIAAAESIRIGSNVICGANVTITDTDWHHADPIKRRDELAPAAPIVVEDNVWLCMNVAVLKGVKIGRGSVIAANSVVAKSIPDNVIAAGQPARVVKSLISRRSESMQRFVNKTCVSKIVGC